MKVLIDNKEIEVIITKKNNKRTYLTVKDNIIYITTNYFVKNKDILNFIKEHENFIKKRIELNIKAYEYDNNFYYLGKKYDIVYMNIDNLSISDSIIFINHNIDINKWLKKEAGIIFKEELDRVYKSFPVNIPYPSLTIRNMKTRWGVCNVKTKRITLNFSLIKRDKKYLTYVIVHELSHLVYPDHSKNFWNLVCVLIPSYKKLRKELNNYE